jgi:phosphate transport system substrate-binding protein
LSGAWAIYPTAVVWAEAFEKIHPDVKIDVSAGGAGKGAADAIVGLVDIGMVSREPDPTELKKDIQTIYVLKDAVYPVVSDKNFFLADLLKKGVSKEILSQIYISGTVTTWNQVVGSKGNKPIHIYNRSDSSGAAASWAAYLGKKQEDLKGVGVYGDPGVLETAKRDPVGIGYNNFSYVFTKEGPLIPGIRLLPIDSNENGVADEDEIYANRKEAIAAIESGRYPASRKNYFFVKNNPSPLIKEFIRFALSEEGTKIVEQVGASLPLQEKERKKVLESLK